MMDFIFTKGKIFVTCCMQGFGGGIISLRVREEKGKAFRCRNERNFAFEIVNWFWIGRKYLDV